MSPALASTDSVMPHCGLMRGLMRSLTWALRRLFVLLLVFDLVSAPLHRHHHDSGIDGSSMHGHLADSTPAAHHIEEDSHQTSFFHAVITVRAESRASAPDGPSEPDAQGAPLAALWLLPWVLLWPATLASAGPSYTEPDTPPHRLHRSLPPAGRAPPVRA